MKTAIKERPILFSAPMVRAILDGKKTQTRRAVKGVFEHKGHDCIMEGDGLPSRIDWAPKDWDICPYGVPGDRLWVRETHVVRKAGVIYRADLDPVEAAGVGGMYGGWKPSIFMRRKSSRITLEITRTKVEQLWEISEQDAIDEGAPCVDNPDYDDADPCDDLAQSHRAGFAELWLKINGQESWDANPWVWAITFKRVEVAHV